VGYRPSFAGFELNAGSAIAGVLPASFQAAAIGSGLTLAWLAIAAVIAEGLADPVFVLKLIPGVIVAGVIAIIIATVLCAFYIGLVGAPLAALLGHRLDSRLGLTVAVASAVITAIVALAAFGMWPLFDTPDWQFALLVFAYALPAGLLYRRAVLTARQFSPFAEARA
jgi:hypothetical protein